MLKPRRPREGATMSITNQSGERIFLPPELFVSRPVRSAKIRQRNQEWLKRKREEELTVRGLARLVKRPPATVAAGLLWAQEEELRQEEVAVAAEQSPEIDPATGLTVDDVLSLATTYTSDTELGSLPEFWRIIDPLLDKILGVDSPGTQLFTAEAA